MTFTLWQLRDGLQKCKPDALVRLRPFGLYVTGLTSWRGIYAEPSITYSAQSYDGTRHVALTAEAFLAEVVAAASGSRTFHGWKGGEYTYSLASPVHVDNPGEYNPGQRIVRVDPEWCDIVVEVDRS